MAIARALGYLSREVPAWRENNGCYSCHNNGDGARALYRAVTKGFNVERDSLRDTSLWLGKPTVWRQNGGDGPFNDRRLANIQFAATLAEASRVESIRDREAELQAGRLLVEAQDKDGSWQLEGGVRIGSPATYGPVLATVVARDALAGFDLRRFGRSIEQANAWLLRQRPKTVLEASGILLACGEMDNDAAMTLCELCVNLIERGQDGDRGWGPYVNSRAEVFDTALVMLALEKFKRRDGIEPMIAAGRDYLVQTQLDDGTWLETTRPSSGESYAQRMSTTAWATIALIESAPRRP